MDEIEVTIKLAENNEIYYLPIRKSDTIHQLKEYCKIISQIPQDQQKLLYKGEVLLNEKLISDYNIEHNHNIILEKKKDQKSVNVPINQNSNKEINPNCIAIDNNKELDITSFFNNIDFNKLDNFYQSLGLGKYSEITGIEPQKMKEMLNDPSTKDMISNMAKDPALIMMALNKPLLKEKIQNNPFFKSAFQDKQYIPNSQHLQMGQNIFQKNERNSIENSGSGISVPPEPFDSSYNNQINQMKNPSSQISNINTFNNNNTRNKENFKNNGINIDYKEKYNKQLFQLKNMGFINEETNIQVLKKSNGNIDNAVDMLLKQ